MSKSSCCHIPIKYYTKNDNYFYFVLVGKTSKCFIGVFYYNALGAFLTH